MVEGSCSCVVREVSVASVVTDGDDCSVDCPGVVVGSFAVVVREVSETSVWASVVCAWPDDFVSDVDGDCGTEVVDCSTTSDDCVVCNCCAVVAVDRVVSSVNVESTGETYADACSLVVSECCVVVVSDGTAVVDSTDAVVCST